MTRTGRCSQPPITPPSPQRADHRTRGNLSRAPHGETSTQVDVVPLRLLPEPRRVGARSGQPRITPMMQRAESERFLMFATKPGADRNPDWYWNLKANPRRQHLGRQRQTRCPRGRAYRTQRGEKYRTQGSQLLDGCHDVIRDQRRSNEGGAAVDNPVAHAVSSGASRCSCVMAVPRASSWEGGPATSPTLSMMPPERRARSGVKSWYLIEEEPQFNTRMM